MTTYSDLSLSLAMHPGTKDILKRVDVDAVKSSLKNILFMSPFERPFDPIGGANLRALLFEPLTPSTAAVAKRNIMLAIEQLEPRAVVEDLYVGDDGNNALNIGILFHVVGNQKQQTLNMVIERTR